VQDRRRAPVATALPRIVRPAQEFLQTESAGGILLLIATTAALVWANGPFGDSYADFWGAHIAVDLNVIEIDVSLQHWVNDALMAVFFFVVGLEIKYELLKGELAEPRKAALPVAAAVGGMVVPAALYLSLNINGGDDAGGWGIPMATDIAFSLGVLSLLGRRIPVSLKVFLLALAIVDDIGAILVIAVFYTDDLAPRWLAAAAAAFALVVIMGRMGIRDVIAYAAVGAFAWLAVFESGVHATVAGVVLGLLTPVEAHFKEQHFAERAPELLDRFGRAADEPSIAAAGTRQSALRDLEELSRESQPVLDRLEHALHPWTSYAIVPLFALANAGVELGGGAVADAARSSVALGIALGLMVGKPVGILLASWIAVRLGVASLPDGVGWRQVGAVGGIAGIGFTVSLFITTLAFSDAERVSDAKIAILFASVVMGVAGYSALRMASRASVAPEDGAQPEAAGAATG
jgi:NhaA family Na+:H+ antiporter